MKPFFEPQPDEITLLVKEDGLSFNPHFHRHIELVYLTKGKCLVTLNGEKNILHEGEFFIAFPNQIHSYQNKYEHQSIVIIFSPDLVTRYKEKFYSFIPKSNIGKADEKLKNLFYFFRDEFNSASEDLKVGYLYAIIAKVIEKMDISPEKAEKSHILRTVIKYCEKNFKNNLSLEITAKELNISKYYLSHIFSDKINMPFNDYINFMRVGESVKLLKETTLSVSEISEKCGFNSVKTFNRAFKKSTNYSPREYRKL